jgi:PhnB protein
MKINPYLFFKGNCEEAFKVYAEVFGGKILAMLPHKGSPAEAQTPAEWQSKIMHAAMQLGEQTLMASDAPPGHRCLALRCRSTWRRRPTSSAPSPR